MEFIFNIYVVIKQKVINSVKKDNGYTLIELMLVSTLIGMVLLLISTNYVSVNRTYVKASTKAKNLEEGRVVINRIVDVFQQYEYRGCEITIEGKNDPITKDEEGVIKKITFPATASEQEVSVQYDKANQQVNLRIAGISNEIGNRVSNFTVKHNDDVLDFTIEVIKEDNGVIPEQKIQLKTSVTLQYTN